MQNKKIILCADDFGQNPEISLGILDLAKRKHLSATSCMVNIPNWDQHIDELKKTGIQIGLHLNLTHGKPLSKTWKKEVSKSFNGLWQVIKLGYFSKIDQEVFYKEIKAQLDAFYKTVGKMPDFIDGHQHVHQLPKVREALIALIKKEDINPWFRTTYSKIKFNRFSLKAVALYFLGGRTFSRLLDKNQLMTNEDFAGDYAFYGNKDYRKFFLATLKKIESGGVIMCHPGFKSLDMLDSIRNFRWEEYQYFSSPFFLNDLRLLNIILQ